jgi:hypothetical protein
MIHCLGVDIPQLAADSLQSSLSQQSAANLCQITYLPWVICLFVSVHAEQNSASDLFATDTQELCHSSV